MLTVSEAAALLRSFDRVLILTHIRPTVIPLAVLRGCAPRCGP